MDGIPNSLEDLAGKQVLSLLLALLPGLIASEIIYTLTVREKKDVVDRVIHGLIHTFVIYVIWQTFVSINNMYVEMGWRVVRGLRGQPWTPRASASLIGLGVCAVAWGVFAVWLINSNRLHMILQKIGLTASSSHPSQWYEAFYSMRGRRYVTLNLKDGKRIFGWPDLWPSSPKEGHIFLTNAEWLDVDNLPGDRPKLDVLIDVTDVSFIEFVPLLEISRKSDGQEPRSTKRDSDQG
ncbi:MAG: hypothetical protein KGM43_15365 [Planctomycetota bacterium]|nr:hypothetical protein [Planctomycetota bacterium]